MDTLKVVGRITADFTSRGEERRCKKCGRLLDETDYGYCERCSKVIYPKKR